VRPSILADTGPLYAALDPDDTLHGRAHNEIALLNRTGVRVVVLCPTLLETYSLALYRLGTWPAQTPLSEVSRRAQLLNPLSDDYDQANQRLLGFRDQRMSLFDAVLATVSQRLKLPVWTFDHHFDVMRIDVWRA